MAFNQVPIKNSVATRLFRVVFVYYFCVTMCLTAVQMVTEYSYEKEVVLRELTLLTTTMEPDLAKNLWDVNIQRVQSTITVLSKLSVITGMTIQDENGVPVVVYVSDPVNRIEVVDQTDPMSGTIPDPVGFNQGYRHQFDIIHDEREKKVGVGTVYYSFSTVLNRVKYGFFLIIINSLLKTVALWAIFLIVSRIILAKPLKKLVQDIREINFDNLEHCVVKIREQGSDELKIVEDTLNDMIQKLNGAQKKIKSSSKELAEKNQRLEELDRLKDEFLANTSHELRTPLHGIIGIAQSIQDYMATLNQPVIRSNLNMIVQSARHLSLLVDDILDFSKLKLGSLLLQRKSVNVRGVVCTARQISKTMVAEKQLTLVFDLVDDLPQVYVDENRFQQILQNLIGSAIKYSQVGTIRISAEQDGRFVKLSVEDSAQSVAPGNNHQLMEPFKQMDDSPEKQNDRVALGLTIARKLVEMHGGKMWLEQSLSGGNIVSFTLPISMEPQTAESQTGSAVSSSGVLKEPVPLYNVENQKKALFTIVVVDDDVVSLQAVLNHLEASGCSVICLQSGRELLRWMEVNEKPDLILLDIMMPRISGFEICRKIRRQYDMGTLPIIFLTASHRKQNLDTGFLLGANDYMTKPFEKSELLARIRVHLQLMLAKRHLQMLRDCANQIADYKEREQMFGFAIEQMASYRLVSDSSMFKEDKLFRRAVNGHDFLNEQPKSDLIDDLFSSADLDGEIAIVNSLEPDHALYRFYNQSGEAGIRGGHFAFLKPVCCQESLLCLFRRKERMPFGDLDREYFANLMEQIRMIETNIQSMLSDQLIQALPAIQPKLSSITHISAAPPYCSVHLENEPFPQEVRISLSNLDLYFKDDSLLKVHRSFLINPNKIIDIQKRFVGNKKYKYEVIVGDLKKHHTIRIGDSFVKKMAGSFPHHFDC